MVSGILLAASMLLVSGIGDDLGIIKRGDANHSGAVNIADASFINNYLYNGGPAPPCMNEADANHDGRVDQSDSVYLLNWLFNGGSAPPAPGPYNTSCTHSSSPTISCHSGC